MNNLPPPVIDSSKLVEFAVNDEHIEFTGRIKLLVGSGDNFERVGEVAQLAICENFGVPKEYLLFFCKEDWTSEGVIAFDSIGQARARAEFGYNGISSRFIDSPYRDDEVRKYLVEDYGVDPESERWDTRCSFCRRGSSEVSGMLASESAVICQECVEVFYNDFREKTDV